MQSQGHKADAAKALGVILRGIELFGKDQSFLPCQERGCVIIENRKGTFVAPKYKNLEGLRVHLEAQYGLISSTIQLPDIRPNYPLRVPHSGTSHEDRSNNQRFRNRSISPHVIELLQKALGSVENPTLDQISRIARNLNLSEAQVYNFVNRNRPKKRRYSTSDIVRPNGRFGFSANPFGTSLQNSDEGSDGGVRSEGASEDDADSATRAAREETKKEVEAMLAAVYQHGHEELYAPVEQNCVSILAKLREASDDDVEMSERKRSRISRREQDVLERAYNQAGAYPEQEVYEHVADLLQWDVARVRSWFNAQRNRGVKARRIEEDEEPRGAVPERRAPEALPDWWVDQARQSQFAAARAIQLEQAAQMQRAAAPQHQLALPHAHMGMMAQTQMAPFPHPFALATAAQHALPQFSAAFPSAAGLV